MLVNSEKFKFGSKKKMNRKKWASESNAHSYMPGEDMLRVGILFRVRLTNASDFGIRMGATNC